MVIRHSKLPKLVIPYYPHESGSKGSFEINTIEEKFVKDYTGFDFDRIEELVVTEFWMYLRDAFIFDHMQSEEGQKYLDDCYRLNQTSPDKEKLRQKYGNGK